MAQNRAQKSGFAAEAQQKTLGKYDANEAEKALKWIQRRTGESFNTSGNMENFLGVLKNGMLLAKLMNSVNPGSVKVPTKAPTMAFKIMELIGTCLTAMGSFGVPKTELFQTVDLYEEQNPNSVVIAIVALGRKATAKGQDGIGPKEAMKNERNFTDEQLKEGQSIIGLQMGTNKGASQAGMNMGKSRHIMD